MKSQNIAKLSFFLSGLNERMNENADIFVKAEGVMKSGTVSYPFSILKKDDIYELSYK